MKREYVMTFEQFINEGIVFKKLSDTELKDLKQAAVDNFEISDVSAYYFINKDKWNYGVYVNNKNQFLVWGNPIKGQGEDFRILKGGEKEAEAEIKKLQ